MIYLPGVILALLTFPGVIVHEAVQVLFCKIMKVPVYDVKYFQFSLQTVGYVHHEEPETLFSSLIISAGPFIVNTLLCVIICFPASLPIHLFEHWNLLSIIQIWLGVSMGMNAFPSRRDAKAIWEKVNAEAGKKNLLAIFSYPLVTLLFISNILKVVCFDALYGAFIGIVLPALLYKNLM